MPVDELFLIGRLRGDLFPKSLDALRGHKVLCHGTIENGTVLRRLKY